MFDGSKKVPADTLLQKTLNVLSIFFPWAGGLAIVPVNQDFHAANIDLSCFFKAIHGNLLSDARTLYSREALTRNQRVFSRTEIYHLYFVQAAMIDFIL